MTNRLELKTALARAGYDELHLRGLDLTKMLDESTWSILSAALGKGRLTAENAEVMNALVVISSVGDPRVWPLKVTRLVASYGNLLAATAAGTSLLDRLPLGPSAVELAGRFLSEAMTATESERAALETALGAAQSFAKNRKPVPGFGVAGREFDERYEAFRDWYHARKPEPGPHWRLLQELAARLGEEFGLRANMAGGFAAIGLDFGFDLVELPLLASVSTNWATLANAREGLRESPEILRQLPAEHIEYVGPAPRRSPRALAAAESSD